MSLIEVAKTGEIKESTMKNVDADGREILIVNYRGNYYAVGKKCTHRGGDLSRGRLDGKIVTCPLHGSKFDVTTGKSISGPKIGPIKFKTEDLPVYKVKVEGNSISVSI
ncbi:MAG: hypothetical protein AVO38_00735 [delta proteobacterium ML8_D]|jgi:nitrite reductase/ring-hydroxylating ferredoxin subunit|nr:MAG: hypothetical protein AVO38_00735 [delta proteobacterium ML8_D]